MDRMTATNLEKKDGLLGKSDPFLIFRSSQNKVRTMYKSEVVFKNLNPQWQQFVLDTRDLGAFGD